MTVLWWLPELAPDPGGIARFAATVGPALAARGNRLDFLVLQGGPRTGALEGIPVRRIPARDALETGTAGAMLAHRQAVAEHKRAVRPALYHVHLCEPSPVLHLSTASAAPAPLVLTLHNEVFQFLSRAGGDTLLGRLAEEATVITAVSVGAAESFLARCPDLADRVVAIPNGISIGPPAAALPAAPVVLIAGRLSRQKGVDRLLRALPGVRASVPGVSVVVAGEGPQRGSLERLAGDLGCAGRVEFTGHVDGPTVGRLIDAARVVAMPSRFEGMPYVALEAGERGRPVVGTAIGGIDEVVVDGVTGVLVPQDGLDDDVSPLADALTRALVEPGLAEQLGGAARERVAAHFGVDACAEAYEVVYRVGSAAPRPRVSVIIPAWNAARHIAETIESVLGQTSTDYEVIVVDDGSTDDTVEVARSAGGSHVVVLRQPHRGIGAARSAGLAVSRGGLIAHLDADDRWPADRLERLVAAFDGDPDTDAVFGCAVEFVDDDAPPTAAVVTTAQAVRLLTCGVIERSAHRRYGHFHRKPMGDQFAWAGRALRAGLRYRQIETVVLHRRIHAGNNAHRFPFNSDKHRLALIRGLLREKRGQDRGALP